MYEINPKLDGFSCLRTGQDLKVADYFEGSPSSAAEGYPASLRATYAEQGAWPITSGEKGMARYRHFLPYLTFPSLGEGATPLIELPTVARDVGLAKVWAKNEGQNPTGSHKDRMSPLVVARAAALGVSTVAAASSGNAAVSLAAYAAAGGLGCAIVTASTIGANWKRALETFGVELVITPTARERWNYLRDKVLGGEWYPATNYLFPPVGSNPFGVQGYKTMAYEIAEDLSQGLPDAILVPTARGDVLWGLWEGFRELRQAGHIAAVPRHFAVEPFPRISRVLDGGDYRDAFPGQTKLSSIGGDSVTFQALEAVRETRGGAVVVGDREAEDGVSRLAALGLYAEASSATCLGALAKLRQRGDLAADESALLVLTSHGFKTAPER
ncbi:MAG: pyridoxal-phosphate dependent enzyme [Rhodospirillales bacterium]|jgi:threonine synthase|nr:pyridoxal-phosphate dependent enzyme [Rhodospirillales bacterium]